MKKVVKKLADIAAQLGPIAKKKDPNSRVQYAFRRMDDIVNALNPLLSAAGIVVTTEVMQDEFHMMDKAGKMAFYSRGITRVHFSDGEDSIFTDVKSGSIDYGDKAEIQEGSMAVKYAYIRVFNIVTDDLIDPDSKNPEVSKKISTQNGANSPKKPKILSISDEKFSWETLKTGKWDGQILKDDIIRLSGKDGDFFLKLTEIQKQASINFLNTELLKNGSK